MTRGEQRGDDLIGLRSIVEQTREIKQDRGRADPSSSVGSLWFMPTGVRALIPRMVGFVTRERFLTTSRLSNMGRIELPDVVAPDALLRAAWLAEDDNDYKQRFND